MNLKSAAANLPVELLRAFVAVNKSGDIAEAAGTLGTAPSEVQAQVAKLEETLGVVVFERSGAGGVRLSDHGKIVSRYAERLLSINDQLSRQLHAPAVGTKIRVGLPRWVLKDKLLEIARRCGTDVGSNRVSLRCDSLEELVRDLSTRLLDVAILCSMTDAPGVMITEWWEDMYWVKSPNLRLDRRQPIPIVSWPGSMSDRLVGESLRMAGIDYVVGFTASDLSTRLAAVAAGLGIMALPERVLGADVQVADEAFLPPLPCTKKGIYIRKNLEFAAVEPLLRLLESCLRPASSTPVTALLAGRRADASRARS